MAKVTAEQYVAKQASRLLGASEDIKRGVANVTEAPGIAAARQADKMLANLTKAITDGTWQKAVAAVSLADWQKRIVEVGIPRMAAGLKANEARNIRTASNLLQAVDDVSAMVKAMPDNGIEDSINRMSTYVREMNKRKGQIRA